MINQELFNEFWRINYGDDSPAKMALKMVMSEMFAKWEVFKTINEPVPVVRYVSYQNNHTDKNGKFFKHSFSDCWFLEFHEDGTVLKRMWDGSKFNANQPLNLWWEGTNLSNAKIKYSWNIELTREDIEQVIKEQNLGWSL